MPRKYLTYRRCQECNAVRAASELKRTPKSTIVGTERKVRCPACGYEAPMWAFLPVPVEKPTEGEQSEGEG